MSGGVNECAIDWVRGDRNAGVTAYAGSRLKGTIERLAEKYPEDVRIDRRNEDGSVFAHVPVRWIKVGPPRKMSEEQRRMAAERLRTLRSERGAEKDGETDEPWDEETDGDPEEDPDGDPDGDPEESGEEEEDD